MFYCIFIKIYRNFWDNALYKKQWETENIHGTEQCQISPALYREFDYVQWLRKHGRGQRCGVFYSCTSAFFNLVRDW